MNYKGVIIEESLSDSSCLKDINIIQTKVEKVTPSHKTPWIKQWTLHTVEIQEFEIDSFANNISTALDTKHEWYADFKNSEYHYIVFRNKVFKVSRKKLGQYAKVRKYGISLGIPDYQLDFSPDIK